MTEPDDQAEDTSDQPTGFSVPDEALLTFQGGGAKGIVHVGALMAIEKLEISIRGVAGTSAGAMVAALVAVGYTSVELLNPATREHLLRKIDSFKFRKATDFFGGGWPVIALVRRAGRYRLSLLFTTIACVGIWALTDYYHPVVAMILSALVFSAGIGAAAFAINGITTVKNVRDFIDLAIRQKIAERRGDPANLPPEHFSFRNLRDEGGLPLKIVATNVSDEIGEVFSFHRTPDVPVADAVAASICLPVIFRPWRFKCARGSGVSADEKYRSFQDGGVISNLPVWTLDTEREEYGCPTIAFAIRSESPDRDRHWIKAIASSVVSGSLEIHTRGVKDMLHVPIKCSLNMLEFDAGLDKLCQAVSNSFEAVRTRIVEDTVTLPAILATASEDIRAATQAVLEDAKADGTWYQNRNQTQVKVAIASQERGNFAAFSIGYGSGFEDVPELGFEELSIAWESNMRSITEFGGSSDWSGAFWRMLVPVSRRTAQTTVPNVDGRPERPLIVVIEFQADVSFGDVDDYEGFFEGTALISEAVISYSNEQGLYDAVQRITSPWN